jgi:signal transduction histidine kinase
MIVHDMKSPLTSIMLSAGLLSRVAPLIGKQVGLVERTRRSCQQLLTMISDMLDVTRLEEGKLDLEREAVPMRQVVEPAVQDVAPLIETADKMLHLALPDDLPPLWIDRNLMTRVVGNLLSNAEKHTEPGGNIWVVGQVGPEPGTLNLSVRDDGEGIPAEFHDTIFERFRQAKNQRLGRRTDTGLGLAFCKLAVEAHGGTINVDSDVSQGSTFTLTLPVARANGDS